TLRRVRLALAYGIPFNRDALLRHLRQRRAVGGWTDDERFAAFLLAFFANDPSKTAAFFDEFRDDFFSQELLARNALAGIEIQSLAQAHRFADARERLAEHRARHLSEQEVRRLQEIIDAMESGNELERVKRQYEQSQDLSHLRLLVAELYAA